MTDRIHPDAKRRAAVADYRQSGDTIAVVAKRHGVARSTLGTWATGSKAADDYAYGGVPEFDPKLWENRGGVLYPLFPERRPA